MVTAAETAGVYGAGASGRACRFLTKPIMNMSHVRIIHKRYLMFWRDGTSSSPEHFPKIYGLAGLRIGYGIAPPAIG